MKLEKNSAVSASKASTVATSSTSEVDQEFMNETVEELSNNLCDGVLMMLENYVGTRQDLRSNAPRVLAQIDVDSLLALMDRLDAHAQASRKMRRKTHRA